MQITNDHAYRGEQGKHLKLNEKSHVEEPFLEQLKTLGWSEDDNQILKMYHQQVPADSFRSSFSEVVLLPKLRAALKKINPFLTDKQTDEVISRITVFDKNSLLECNEQVFNFLLENTTVSVNEQTGEVSPTVRFIDFDNVENNIFTAISQFKVQIIGTDHHIIPDIVLFVNGLPLVVVEAKAPTTKEPIAEAIDQLLRYSEQRGEAGEGNKKLFYYNQFIITTCANESKFGTITTHNEKHFYRWTDPHPRTVNDLVHGKSSPNDQQRLVAGMLDRRNLLDIMQVFTVFRVDDKGKKMKVVGRYQQFRAVKIAVKRLIEGKNPLARGGIIWHTQGSGKSLTMMFLVREMRLNPTLSSWKIIFVTDRTQLEAQLSQTGQNIGFSIKTAKNTVSLKKLLSNSNADLVMAMIHKFQENGDLEGLQTFSELNNSSKILIMTDEAHRSQYSILAANLDKALPNATSIGFTGTPTEKTETKYKDYIDKYTMRQSIEDGVTLEIVYEGVTHNPEILDKEGMDKEFEDVFSENSITERLQILGFGTRDAYLDAEPTITAKAVHMVNHYVESIFTGGFKAQIVANSRASAVRYKSAIETALLNKINDLKENNPLGIDIELLTKLKVAVVISGVHNDEMHIKMFTNSADHNKSIKSFKLPFDATDTDNNGNSNGNVGIIIVNNMLLTGFDAPIEQVMYLDRVITAHNLLQTIARVNRVGAEGKDKGFIVDYVGVGHHLKTALDTYADKEIEEVLACISDEQAEINKLIEAHNNMWAYLKTQDLEDFSDVDAFLDMFYDEDIRFEYLKLFNQLTTCFNNVLPNKKALDFLTDWKSFKKLNELIKVHFKDGRFSMRGIPQKLRRIADAFLGSGEIIQSIAPISIISENFLNDINVRKRDKTKAAAVEHAIRHYIDLNMAEDPELFASFAKVLEDILTNFKGNWGAIFDELEKLREIIRNREKEITFGLDRLKEMPFFRILKAELFGETVLNENEITRIVSLTQNIFKLLLVELQLTGFWDSIPAQNRLKGELQKILLSEPFKDIPTLITKRNEVISRMMELAKNNHFRIISA